jgi:urea transport system permease protein
VIWVAVGGRGTLVGAALGAVLVNYAKTVLTGVMPDAWLFALGALFVVVTLFLPRGLVGTAIERVGSRRAAAALPPEPDIAPERVEQGQGA